MKIERSPEAATWRRFAPIKRILPTSTDESALPCKSGVMRKSVFSRAAKPSEAVMRYTKASIGSSNISILFRKAMKYAAKNLNNSSSAAQMRIMVHVPVGSPIAQAMSFWNGYTSNTAHIPHIKVSQIVYLGSWCSWFSCIQNHSQISAGKSPPISA